MIICIFQFDDYDPVDKIILQKEHKVKGAKLEVKKAMPRDADAGPMRGGRGGGGRGNRATPGPELIGFVILSFVQSTRFFYF